MLLMGIGVKLVRGLESHSSRENDSSRLYLLQDQKSESSDGLLLQNDIPASSYTSFGLCEKIQEARSKMMNNTLNYIPAGDYYIPEIILPECPKPIGKWGRIYQNFLKKYHPIRYSSLIISGQLWACLGEFNEQAQQRLDTIITQMTSAEAVTEELKAADPMAWVGAMNSICSRAEEIVLQELLWEEEAI